MERRRTEGCLLGRIAGAFYGFGAIPERLVKAVKDRQKVDALIERPPSAPMKLTNGESDSSSSGSEAGADPNCGTDAIIGVIVGDIAGSRFESRNHKSKVFNLMVSKSEAWGGAGKSSLKRRGGTVSPGESLADGGSPASSHSQVGLPFDRPCYFTDDTVMTLAVAQALSDWRKAGSGDCGELSEFAIRAMQDFGRRYPTAGYGGSFARWLEAEQPRPYNSWGNGAAMRVGACGVAARTLDEVKALSRAVTEVTHDHPEGIKGAEATAVSVFLAREGWSKDNIKTYVSEHYYPMDFTLDEIRPSYDFDVSCQGSVPPALEAFFESASYEDAIRNAISIGGDSDTLAAICGAVAGAYYGVPREIRNKGMTFLPEHLLEVLYEVETGIGN